jgi:hypothetical protein
MRFKQCPFRALPASSSALRLIAFGSPRTARFSRLKHEVGALLSSSIASTVVACILSTARVEAGALSDSLDTCIEDSAFCSERPLSTFENPCGPDFTFVRGRVAWRPLRNTGPVTISVQTRSSALPLYVKVAPITAGYPDSVCVTYFPGAVVLVAHGAQQCEGVWETIGPISLDLFVRPGAPYLLVLEGLETLPIPPSNLPLRSAAVRCVRVTPFRRSPAQSSIWGRVKMIYGVPAR